MRRKLLTVLACAATFACAGVSKAQLAEFPTVWTGIVFATVGANANPLPPEIAPYKAKLENIFGYSRFIFIGQHTENMVDPLEHWFVPAKTFSVQATAKRAAETLGYTVDLQLFHERDRLVSTKVWLAPRNPLFIRGPLCGSGQLIIILLVK